MLARRCLSHKRSEDSRPSPLRTGTIDRDGVGIVVLISQIYRPRLLVVVLPRKIGALQWSLPETGAVDGDEDDSIAVINQTHRPSLLLVAIRRVARKK